MADLASAIDDIFGGEPETVGVNTWLNTGYPPLNNILSGCYDGGLPCGRLVELYGDSSCGKCVTKDTMLLSPKGMLTLEEFFQANGYEPFNSNKEVEVSAPLLNENNLFENTSHFTFNGKRKIIKTTGTSGRTIKTTSKHPLRVLTESGFISWRNADEIQVGDVLVTQLGTDCFPDETNASGLTVDEATFIGYMVADGSLGNENTIRFSNSDPDISADFLRIAEKILGITPTDWKVASKGGSVDYYLYNTELRHKIAEKYDLHYVTANGKDVPLCVRTAQKHVQAAFIRAYFELDGFYGKISTDIKYLAFELTSASKVLIEQVQLMLLNFGLFATINEKKVKGYEHNEYWRLYISGTQINLMLDLFPNISKAVNDRINECSFDRTHEKNYNLMLPTQVNKLVNDLYESVPYALRSRDLITPLKSMKAKDTRLSKDTVSQLLQKIAVLREYNPILYKAIESLLQYQFEQVASVELLNEMEPVFDVCLPVTHSFWSNGFISHNTMIANAVMSAAQKVGGVCVFMDHERSFMKDIAEENGLDLTKGKFSLQFPDTFESSVTKSIKWMQYIRDNALIPSDAPLVVVYDSLASMVPKSKLAKDVDEQGMNDSLALAKACSAVMPTLSLFAEKYNCLILFLNQTRENPGITFGSNVTTPGGKAPKFYASVRIELSRSMIKKDGEVLGQKVKCKTIKNKVYRPFLQCEWDFMFREDGTGFFDVVGGTVDHLCEKGVLKKGGAFIEWTSGKKYNKSKLVDLIGDNAELRKELFSLLP